MPFTDAALFSNVPPMAVVWPFLLAEIIVLFLLILFPQLVMKPLEWMY